MPSTRSQKANEKHSRQSDVMSDLEDVMLIIFTEEAFVDEPEVAIAETDSVSVELQDSTVTQF